MCSPRNKAAVLLRGRDDLRVWKWVRVLGAGLFSGSPISCQVLGFFRAWAQTPEAPYGAELEAELP